jgi:hypothetical protein
MTNYNTTITTSPSDFNGDTTTSFVSGQFNDKQHFSSEDFNPGGVQVIDKNGDRKAVLSTADFADTDVVNVAGIPMTVAQARAAGFDVAVEASAANAYVPQAPGEIAGETDEAPVDTRTADDGRATDAELVALDNVTSAVRLHTGMDLDATLELGKDVLTGQAPEQAFEALQARGISKDAVHGSINQIVSIGQSAAMKELGDAGYRELSALADNSAAIKSVVIDHGIKRMSGRSKGVTWKHVLTLARQFARA